MQVDTLMSRTKITRTPGQTEGNADQHERRPLDGPVIRDLAKASTPGIAALDAAWAAEVLAGRASDATELHDWLTMTGLVAVPPWWSA